MGHQLQTIIHRDGEGGIVTESIQDCTEIAEFCAEQRAKGHTGSGEMKHAAMIPEVMVQAYCNNNRITFRDFMVDKTHIKRLLADPALKAFRIWEGKV
jgi:hypothetical protein